MASAGSGKNIEEFVPGVKYNGLNTAKAVDFSSAASVNLGSTGTVTLPATLTGAVTFSGAVTLSSTLAATGAITPTGGVAAAGGFSVSPRTLHTGNVGFAATTAATQKQIVTTETYYAEVFVPANMTITGIAVLQGHTTNASVNINVGLANSSGVIVASSATTTAQGAADAWQQIPFSTTYSAVGPATYYIAVQGSATTGYIATHTIGNFGAKNKTSETYGTFVTTASYSSTTFTTAVGPVADLY